ncbi:putative phage tail protein [Bosea sp. FBZP-16]|uniref:YmfQ family protein n=1 Tax=Bosea sp. FBZP-16 TaxID=2065382 RepID=UPI000C306DB5|nr:putative phage tail protein [Bosea sp. FBZP-16]
MSRSEDQILEELLSELPPGWIWRRDRDSVIAALLTPLAAGIAEMEAVAEAMLLEVDPRDASACLTDFERVLGPDPCGRDTSTMSLGDRRQLAHQRWTARGGASRQYFINLAAKRGVTITISENLVTYAGELECGEELIEPPEQFIWTVHLGDLSDETLFEADEGQAGDRLYDLTISDIECDIRRLKPAHTEVVFDYGSL